MKALKFYTNSSCGHQTMYDQKMFSDHLRELHKRGVKTVPLVLVEGVPGEKSPKWMHYEEYKKLLKKEETRNVC